LLGAIALIALLIFVFKRFGKETAGGRFAQAFSDNCRRLVVAPKLLFPGLIYSFLVQVALSGTLALSLCAVSHEPVPWLRLIWTLPIISIISALPITIAGMGVRDGAALALWGLCGINGATAVAATVLTASISLLWALVGGIVLWHETRRRHVLREIETAAVLERVEI
jgi:uncharacterized membrane protein YbhN (UPF0104 family)